VRKAVKIRFIPRNDDHPYLHKDIYLDKNAMEPMYSFAYDRKGELWKIIWHAKRWSGNEDFTEYEGTGTGNRIEIWDRNGTPPKSKGKIRRFIDVGRLTKGR
jgi:hypothetical protein